MEVIVVQETGFGGMFTYVYKYSKETYIRIVKNEYRRAKKYSRVDNVEEVEEWLNDCDNNEDVIPYDISIYESDTGIHYTVCKVEEY